MAPSIRSLRRPLPGLIILTGAVLLTGSLIIGFLLRAGNDGSANTLPRSIAGYPLKTAKYGSEAIAEIARMHGEEFPTTSGSMGIYGDASQISLWIEGFQDESTASQILNDMTARIALGNTPFSPDGQKQVGSRAVNQLDGMGQKHVYFQSGNLVLWLAAEPSIADRAIRQILEEYP